MNRLVEHIHRFYEVFCKIKLELLFLIIATPVVISNAFIVGPFQGADERNHFFRSILLTHGELIGEFVWSNGDNRPGGYVDKSSIEISGAFDDVKFHKEIKIRPEKVESYRGTTWSWPEKEGIDFANTVIYPPFFYIPSAIGLKLSQVINSSILNGVVWARLINGLISILIVVIALYKARFGKTIIFVVSSLPMSLSLFGLIGQDGLIISSLALVLAIATRGEKSTAFERFLGAALLGMIIAAKIVYFPLALLLFTPTFKNKENKDFYLLISLTLLIAICWVFIGMKPLKVPFRIEDGVNAKQQLEFMFNNINLWPQIAISTLKDRIDFYYVSFIGNLGWLDVNLRDGEYLYFFMLFIAALLCDVAVGGSILLPKYRILVGISIVASILCIFGSMYLGWTPVGDMIVDGVQGRYFLPVALSLLLGIIPQIHILQEKKAQFVQRVLCLMMAYAIYAVPNALMVRYWG